MYKRLLLVPVLLVLMVGSVHAQVALDSLHRRAYAHYEPTGLPVERLEMNSVQVGPFDADYVIEDGDIRIRSVHRSTFVIDNGELSLDGYFQGEITDTGSSFTGVTAAAASLFANFTVATEMYLALELTAADGAAFLIDTTSGEYLFYLTEPGSFTLDSLLAAGHTYQFQFEHHVGHYGGGPATRARDSSFSLVVSNNPVAADAASWGDVKALFR